jgi:hypothetical protein
MNARLTSHRTGEAIRGFAWALAAAIAIDFAAIIILFGSGP